MKLGGAFENELVGVLNLKLSDQRMLFRLGQNNISEHLDLDKLSPSGLKFKCLPEPNGWSQQQDFTSQIKSFVLKLIMYHRGS